jgi:hypothetical protein
MGASRFRRTLGWATFAGALLACSVVLLTGTRAEAASIDDRRTAACDVRLSGEIEAGDALRLVAALQAVDWSSAPAKRPRIETEITYFGGKDIPRLCLDSPGGSFSEAINFLTETLHTVSYASVLEPLAECYSACALIFLGGHLHSGDGYIEQYRRLDVSGKLGFHAPYVAPTAAQKVDPAMVGKSYTEGVQAVADLLDREPLLFPRSLLAEFLRVGPDEFYTIDRVGQLSAWNIGLTGYRRPTVMTEKQIEHVCNNQRMRDDPQLYTGYMSFEAEPEQTSDPIPLSDKLIVRSEEAIEGVAGCTVEARLYGDTLFLRADTTSVDAGDAEPQNEAEGNITSSEAVLADMNAVDPDGYTPAYFLFDPQTKFRTLRDRGGTSSQATTADRPSAPSSTATATQATLWDHNGSTMVLRSEAARLIMEYEMPRKGMQQVGVRKGDNLLTCSRDGSNLSCTTRIFHPRCGKHDFAAEGRFSDNDRTIRIQGDAPRLDDSCRENGRKPQNWTFTYLSPAR